MDPQGSSTFGFWSFSVCIKERTWRQFSGVFRLISVSQHCVVFYCRCRHNTHSLIDIRRFDWVTGSRRRLPDGNVNVKVLWASDVSWHHWYSCTELRCISEQILTPFSTRGDVNSVMACYIKYHVLQPHFCTLSCTQSIFSRLQPLVCVSSIKMLYESVVKSKLGHLSMSQH